MNKRAYGFTIVELLIVIVVIAILATITVVAYNGITEQSRVSAVKADLNGVSKKIELYAAQNGSYPATVAQLRAAGITVASQDPNIAMYCGDASGYAVFINTRETTYNGRQFKVGNDTALTEVLPKIAWSSGTLCGSTPYPSLAWRQHWSQP